MKFFSIFSYSFFTQCDAFQKFFLLIDERGNKNENGKASVCEKEEEKVNIFGNNLCNFRPEVSFLLFFSFYLCNYCYGELELLRFHQFRGLEVVQYRENCQMWNNFEKNSVNLSTSRF